MEPNKKISYKSLQEKMSETQLKQILSGCGGDFLCWRYCWTYDGIRTASTYLPSCYDHYHECTQHGWIADCACYTGM